MYFWNNVFWCFLKYWGRFPYILVFVYSLVGLCCVCILLLTIHLIMVRFFMKIIAPRPHLLLLHGLRTHDGYIPNSLLPKFKSQTELFECLLRQKLQSCNGNKVSSSAVKFQLQICTLLFISWRPTLDTDFQLIVEPLELCF